MEYDGINSLDTLSSGVREFIQNELCSLPFFPAFQALHPNFHHLVTVYLHDSAANAGELIVANQADADQRSHFRLDAFMPIDVGILEELEADSGQHIEEGVFDDRRIPEAVQIQLQQLTEGQHEFLFFCFPVEMKRPVILLLLLGGFLRFGRRRHRRHRRLVFQFVRQLAHYEGRHFQGVLVDTQVVLLVKAAAVDDFGQSLREFDHGFVNLRPGVGDEFGRGSTPPFDDAVEGVEKVHDDGGSMAGEGDAELVDFRLQLDGGDECFDDVLGRGSARFLQVFEVDGDLKVEGGHFGEGEGVYWLEGTNRGSFSISSLIEDVWRTTVNGASIHSDGVIES